MGQSSRAASGPYTAGIDDRRLSVQGDVRAIVVADAIGRSDALAAVLTLADPPSPEDLAWGALPAQSLAGLVASLGHAHLDDRVERIGAQLAAVTVAPADQRGDLTRGLIADLDRLRAALRAEARPVPAAIDVTQIAAAAGDEVLRTSGQMGVEVTSDVVCDLSLAVPSVVAAAVLDALGNVIRHGVRAECGLGGSARIGFRRESDGFSITIGNRGNAASREGDLRGGGVGLDAAASRLSAAGCVMAVSDAPWGGTSVTIQVPLPERRNDVRFR